jgi:integrase
LLVIAICLLAITKAAVIMKSKITKRTVDSAEPGKRDCFIWDSELKGFGLKVTPAGKRIYIVQYRTGGRGSPTRRFTIGKHGAPWTPDKARTEAKRLLGSIADGNDPQTAKAAEKTAMTVNELCTLYLKDGCETKKASTIATDRGRIKRHIKPLLGRKRVKDLTPNDIRRFMADIANGKTTVTAKTGKHGLARVTGGKGTATRTVGLLGGIMSFAVGEGVRPDNPVIGIKRYPDKQGERFLSHAELGKLGEVLSAVEETEVLAVPAIRLLIMTGCRKSEILSLKWSEVDFEIGCLRLADSKTGHKIVMLGAPALQTLANQSRQAGSEYVFPAMKGKKHYVGLPKAWARIRKQAGLEGVRLHDLRHSFASIGAAAGMGLQVVGKLLGQKDPKTTARYSHIADDPARAAADRIAGNIAAAMNGEAEAEIVELKKWS